MVEKVIKKIFERRHFWRTIGFDELSELYASEFLRNLSMSVIGIFVPIYLYKLGFNLQAIFAMQVIWAASRPIFLYIAAKSVAIFGPKHTMALGTLVQILYLSVLISIETAHWPLALLAVLGSLSYALYNIAIQVDFSKVKHTEHGGKELSFITICERVGSALGPLAGGLIASFINPQATIFVAIIFMIVSLLPLFLSAEPTRTKQKIVLRGFPWRRHKWDFVSATFFGVENVVSIVIWPLFIALTLFKTNTYASIGLLVSVSTGTALLAIFFIGRLIDNHKGGLLLRVGAISNSVVHLVRPFVSGPLQAIFVSFVNEPMTASYRMPYTKGLYDAADSVVGYRIVYLTLVDAFRMFGLFVFWLSAYIASFFVSSEVAILQAAFFVAAISSLGILTQRFPALKS